MVRETWFCLRFARLCIVGLLLLMVIPQPGKAMVPRVQNTLATDPLNIEPFPKDSDTMNEVRRPQERNLRERVIADAVANAFADVIRAKADTGSTTTAKKATAAAQQSKVTPSTTPMNTKEFAYTNIRFKSFVNDDASDRQDDSFIQSLQETALKDAEQKQQEETPKRVEVPQDDTDDLEAQLNAKLAAIQKEMSDLEDLKKALEASKSGEKSGSDLKRRLLFSMPDMQPFKSKQRIKNKYSDTGAPGWDAFKLLNKKSDFAQDNIDRLQKNVGERTARLNTQLVDLLSFGTEKLADIAVYEGDKQVVRSDKVRMFLEAIKDANEDKIGRLQDILLSVMDRAEVKKSKILDKIY